MSRITRTACANPSIEQQALLQYVCRPNNVLLGLLLDAEYRAARRTVAGVCDPGGGSVEITVFQNQPADRVNAVEARCPERVQHVQIAVGFQFEDRAIAVGAP